MDTSQVYSSTSTGSAMGDQNQASSGGRGGRRRELETLSVEIRNYPRDLLQSFTSTDRHTAPQQRSEMEERRNEEEETGEGEGEGEDKDVEFNLGLSLGGRFGLDKSHRGLIRSSSIAGSIPCLGKEEGEGEGSAALARTCSLPTATEEEWRRRKATLRRMEARRRRSQKQRTANAKETGLPPPPNPKPGFFRSLQGLLAHHHCSRQSADSQASTSSAASPLDSKPIQGEATTPTSSQSMQIQDAMVGPSSSKQSETPEQRKKKKKKKKEEEEEEEGGSSGMEDMPSVFTIGDGPNGRKVEGILYRYARGEQVRIMCVCHGTFFSPSDFVKHAGGTNVDHPHRHIVVNPSSFSFP